jgi:hypothetical protein
VGQATVGAAAAAAAAMGESAGHEQEGAAGRSSFSKRTAWVFPPAPD